eukprot:gnl/Spiro4/9897_TR5249_c0_g1_i1.p1 gnl/Spiro4/9897_TR5249_c0_g1~~gnl/Spiro4/9897_TR5249_c0_g1_i1.p1  ORF type:complete len:367 (-),score=73.04 gnl/Spiro4/9897_TR5249_c0_g1_i1:68-1168(-)
MQALRAVCSALIVAPVSRSGSTLCRRPLRTRHSRACLHIRRTKRGAFFFTFESGVTSSPLIVVNASSGQLLWYTEELVVTLIWRVRAVDGVAYCGWNVAANNIFCTVRLYDGQKLWSKDNLTFSDPGLWDNPNLVVDAAGAHTFMYTKPHEGLRCVTGFDSKTGQQLWYLPQTGDVDDYDTFAWNGQYFRLMTVPDTNDTSMVVQMRDGATGDSKWSTTFNSNSDCIVLVGGDTLNSNGFVVVFGLTENQLFGFDALTGSPLWVFSDINSPTTGILDRSGWLYFGDGTGTYRSIAANLTLTSSDLQQAHMTTLVKVAIILGVSFGTIFAVSGVLWLIQHCNVPEETAAADIQNTQQYASTIAYKQL